MKIVMDMYGGDNAPLAPLKGAALAVKTLGVSVVAVGNVEEMKRLCAENSVSTEGFEWIDAPLVMPVCAEPTESVKGKYKESSLSTALRALAEGKGDAFVGAGSTGAIVVAATLLVKRIKGVKRAALASVIPGVNKDYMLLDLGANVECRPEMLSQFGLMGSVYMEKVEGVKDPAVGLINIGAEESKGTDLQKEALSLMKNAPYRFIGNVEARDLPFGACDVAVADGFTGNVVLKLTEGLGLAFGKMFKGILTKNIWTKLGTLPMKSGISSFKKKLDYTEKGGAPLLGIAKPVIKAHGSSDEKAFQSAIRQAKNFYEQDIVGTITKALTEQKEDEE